MRMLIAGGSGLIGTALRASQTGGPHEFISLVRHGSSGPNAVAWDPQRRQIDHAALDQLGPIDAVINLSGAGIGDHRWNEKVKTQILESRLSATTYLADLIPDVSPVPSVFISASATGYYGDRGDDALTEESPPGRGFLADVCQRWEAAAAPTSAVTRTVLLRTGVVLSSQGGALAKQLPLFRWGVGGRLGNGRQYISWVSMADHIGIIERILVDDSLSGPINSTAPQPVTNANFTQTLAQVLHRPSLFTVPTAALRLALGHEMADELLLASARVLPGRMSAASYSFKHREIAQALSDVSRT